MKNPSMQESLKVLNYFDDREALDGLLVIIATLHRGEVICLERQQVKNKCNVVTNFCDM